MRYHYDKPDHYTSMYGQTYICDHPVYSHCTLYKIGEKGLAVIQQRYIPEIKSTYWTEIDPWLVDVLYLHEGFKKFFDERARECKDGLYPRAKMGIDSNGFTDTDTKNIVNNDTCAITASIKIAF